MKRRYIICFLLLIFSFLCISNPSVSTYASTTFSTNIYTPHLSENKTIEDYADLTGITYFTVLDTDIYYTLDGTSVNIYCTVNKTITKLNHTFTSIDYMDSAYGYLFVSDNKELMIFHNDTLVTLPTEANDCTISGYDCISTHFYSNALFVSYVKNNNLHYHSFKYNLDTDNFTSLSCKDYKSSDYSNIFDNVTLITISNNKIFIVSNNIYYSITIDTLLDITYSTDSGFNTLNINKIAYISSSDKNYLICAYPNSIEIYDTQNSSYLSHSLEFSSNGLSAYSTGVLRTPKYIDVNGNNVYISDDFDTSRNIQAFTIDESGFTLEDGSIKATTLLSSFSADIGRFYDALDILSNEDSVYVADSKNNRVQILNNNSTIVIENLHSYNYTSPNNLMLDEYNNLYFTINTSTTHSSILKFDGNSIISILDNVGNICSTTITYKNVIYALDSTNGKLIKIENGSTSVIKDSLSISNTAKIEYIIDLDTILMYDNDTFTLLDTTGNTLATKSSIGVIDYTVDYAGNVYIMTSTNIHTMNIVKNDTIYSFSTDENLEILSNFSNYTCIDLNSSKNTIYLYNSKNECIEYYSDSSIGGIYITPPVDAYLDSALTNIDSIKPATITTTSLIYQYPYNLGNIYNLDYSIENIFVLGECGEFYYILFNSNNTLCDGYIKKDRVTIKTITPNQKNVITVNQKVAIYKYPTILRHNDIVYTIGTLDKNTKITTSAYFPISIDNRLFYIYNLDNCIGFIYAPDVVIGVSNIEYLPTTNARIRIIDKTDYVNVYEDKDNNSKVLDTLLNDKRLNITNYDKNAEYTYITYVDENQETRHGYIKTENIVMDGIDQNTITLLIIIGVTTLIFITLLVTFISIKRKRRL